MKKTYMAPLMEQDVMEDVQPLCTSGLGGSGIAGAPGHGGVDTGGVLEPSAKEMEDFGDDLRENLW